MMTLSHRNPSPVFPPRCPFKGRLSTLSIFITLLVFTAGTVQWASPPADSPPGDVWQEFWQAGDSTRRLKAVEKILATTRRFEDLWSLLKAGRRYSPRVKKGLQVKSRQGASGLNYPYAFFVPRTYDPSRAYPVIFYLHGGIMRPPYKKKERWWNEEDGMYSEGRISVFPASWDEAPWWHYSQVENLAAILEQLKTVYHIDENRVYLAGFSDGATGAYYQAFKNPTPWAAFLALVGHVGVLCNPGSGAQGGLYTINLTNKPFLVFNCGKDRLYTPEMVQPFLELLRSAGCDIVFRLKSDYGHGYRWLGEEVEGIKTFIRQHPRDPYPDRLAWETEAPESYGRIHWLIINRLGKVAGESQLKPYDTIWLTSRQPPPGPGLEPAKRPVLAFPRKKPTGRVELQKQGNRVLARTMGVKTFTLLISPEDFDFGQPIQVFTNGTLAFSGSLTRDPGILLKWAARDLDRSMLFGAELPVEVKGSAPGNPPSNRAK
jgi:predicted esterase